MRTLQDRQPAKEPTNDLCNLQGQLRDSHIHQTFGQADLSAQDLRDIALQQRQPQSLLYCHGQSKSRFG